MRLVWSRIACTLAAVLLSFTSASAQWEHVQTFPAEIISIYFHKIPGQEMTGFVGLSDGSIWKTITNGSAWSATTSPADVEITSFTFKDVNIGWASYKDPVSANQKGGVLKTTDGGNTWTNLTLTYGASAVYYHPATSRLFVSQWQTGSVYSTDEGNSWNNLGPQDWNGYTFFDANVGIVSTLQGKYHRTTDGGVTWTMLPMMVEAWTPLAIPGTNLVFVAAEEADTMFRSLDGGLTFRQVGPLGNKYTGHVEYDCIGIYVQTQDQGILRSTNLGESWVPLFGPSNDKDRSFELTPFFLFAGGFGGNLYRFEQVPYPPTVRLSIPKANLRITSMGCEPVDSLLYLRLVNFCSTFVITDISLIGSSRFQLTSKPTLPHTMKGYDSIGVSYTGPDFNRDTTRLRIQYTVDGVPYDTVLVITAQRFKRLNFTGSWPKLAREVKDACTILDTTYSLINTPCDQITLLSASLTDSSVFRLTHPGYPRDLAPNEKLDFRIRAQASVQNTFKSALHLKFLYSGTPVDTLIPLEYKVRLGPRPNVLMVPNIKVDHPCAQLDTAILYLNNQCDGLWLDSAWVEPGKGITMTGQLPTSAGPTEALRLPIRILGAEKGVYNVRIFLRYRGADGPFDTVVTMTYEVKNTLPRKLGVPSTVKFGGTSICNPRVLSAYITNILCENISVTNAVFTSADPTLTIVSQPAFPITLGPGQRDSLVLQYAPTSSTPLNISVRVTMLIRGQLRDTFFAVTGVGITNATASVTDSALVFDTLFACERGERYTYIRNESCDDITVTGFTGLNGQDYIILEPTFPITLKRGDSIRVVVRTKQNTGQNTDSLRFNLQAGASQSSVTLVLDGFIKPPVRLLDIGSTMLRFDSIAPCTTRDTTLWLHNRGVCDTLELTSVNPGNPWVVIQGSGLPIRLAPGESVRVDIRILAGASGSTATTTLRFQGPAVDTQISIQSSTATGVGSGQLVLTFDPATFTVKPCEQTSREVVLKNEGCQDITLSVAEIDGLAGQTQFSILGGPTLPRTLAPGQEVRFQVQFDGDGTGPGTAFLVLRSADNSLDRRIPLTGVVDGTTSDFGVGFASIDGQPAISRNVGEAVVLALTAADAVAADKGLDRVEFDLGYDIDMLTLKDAASANGWNITTAESGTGTRVTLTKNGTKAVAPGEKMGELEFYTTLGRNTSTVIGASNLQLNGNDAQFNRCVVRPTAATGSVTLDVTPVCADTILRKTLRNEKILMVIGISPNPTEGQDRVDVTVNAAMATDALLYFHDMRGRVLSSALTVKLSAGTQEVSVPLPPVEGVAFLTLEASGVREIRKVVVRATR